jgi:signal transduction histidine kinase/DNA-binding response OmpR family regulator
LSGNRLLLLAAIPIFLVLLVIAYLSVRFAADERAQQGWTIHTYQVIGQAQRVLSDAQDAETSQRGYIITRQDSFLQPFHRAEQRIGPDLLKLKALTADNPIQQARADALAAIVAKRFGALNQSLALAPTNNTASSSALLSSMAAGKSAMDSVRGVIASAIAEEERLLAQRIAARREAERREIQFAVVGALLAFLLLLVGVLVLVRNNLLLTRSEQSRARQAEALQATLDNIRKGLAVFGPDETLRVFNGAFFRLLEFPPALARNGAHLSEFRAWNAERSKQIFDDLPLEPRGTEAQARHIVVGEGDIECYRAAMPDGGFLVACLDVTVRVRAETSLRVSQKMEAVGQLTGGVAHDFNNLLQIISANLDLVANDMRGQPRTAERLQNAIAAVDRGSRLTAQLLAFARRQALEPRSTNLGRLVQDITELLRRTLGETIEIESIVAGGLWNTLVDPNQVENAVLNLAINARDAMPDGGKLTIEVANTFLDDAYAAEHEEVVPGQYVMLAVSDTGSGMPAEVAARAFDPFFTTKAEGRGTGLGLSQVYGFTKQSGGHIKIYSEIGQGTTVKLYLPRTRQVQEPSSAVTKAPAVEGGQETILVVEDDAGVRAATVDMLAELGYSVLRAENADQALVILASGVPVDVLFTDVVMPGPLTTRELARRAQTLHPNLAVLYTSGYTQNAIVHNGKLDDGVTLISKPYRRDELARKLRTMLNDARKEAAPPAGPRVEPEREKPMPRKKVLVVEDVALIRMSTVDMVEEVGFEAVEASDGAQALAILQQDPHIDVLLTDLGLPVMNGRQLMDEALRLKPSLKVIIASGYSTELEAGGVGVKTLMKPYDISQLRKALEG